MTRIGRDGARRCSAALVVIGSLVGCGGGWARSQANDDFVDQLVDGGLDRTIAECVVDRFFEGRSDDELESFFDRPEVTEAENEEFAELGQACGVV